MEKKTITFANGLECYYVSSKEETECLFSEIFAEQQYAGHNLTVKDGDCIFDVGANIGLFSLFIHQLHPPVKIYAFEPIQPIYQVLRDNIERHQLPNVSAFNYGLSSENHPEKTFIFYPKVAGNSTMHPEWVLADPGENPSEIIEDLLADFLKEQQTVTCEVKTLSTVIQELNVLTIDLLKIDVEGEEYEVLKGIEEKDWSKIKQIVAEVHDKQGRLAKITTLLNVHGFEVTVEKRELLPSTFADTYILYGIRSLNQRFPLEEN